MRRNVLPLTFSPKPTMQSSSTLYLPLPPTIFYPLRFLPSKRSMDFSVFADDSAVFVLFSAQQSVEQAMAVMDNRWCSFL